MGSVRAPSTNLPVSGESRLPGSTPPYLQVSTDFVLHTKQAKSGVVAHLRDDQGRWLQRRTTRDYSPKAIRLLATEAGTFQLRATRGTFELIERLEHPTPAAVKEWIPGLQLPGTTRLKQLSRSTVLRFENESPVMLNRMIEFTIDKCPNTIFRAEEGATVTINTSTCHIVSTTLPGVTVMSDLPVGEEGGGGWPSNYGYWAGVWGVMVIDWEYTGGGDTDSPPPYEYPDHSVDNGEGNRKGR